MFFKERRMRKKCAKSLYRGAVAQARQPSFYTHYQVPDSVDGRFEMIALHCYMIMRRLQVAGDIKLSQALFDAFFVQMDRSLREMGVGDLGVPKHMKRMMQGFNGRLKAYEAALDMQGDDTLLVEALMRNVYGTIDTPMRLALNDLVSYVRESVALETQMLDFAPLKEQEKCCA